MPCFHESVAVQYCESVDAALSGKWGDCFVQYTRRSSEASTNQWISEWTDGCWVCLWESERFAPRCASHRCTLVFIRCYRHSLSTLFGNHCTSIVMQRNIQSRQCCLLHAGPIAIVASLSAYSIEAEDGTPPSTRICSTAFRSLLSTYQSLPDREISQFELKEWVQYSDGSSWVTAVGVLVLRAHTFVRRIVMQTSAGVDATAVLLCSNDWNILR